MMMMVSCIELFIATQTLDIIFLFLHFFVRTFSENFQILMICHVNDTMHTSFRGFMNEIVHFFYISPCTFGMPVGFYETTQFRPLVHCICINR